MKTWYAAEGEDVYGFKTRKERDEWVRKHPHERRIVKREEVSYCGGWIDEEGYKNGF